MKIIVGGTFDRIHKGHKALLDKAIELSQIYKCELVVTVTEDYLSLFKSHPVRKYKQRAEDVKKYVRKKLNHSWYSLYPYYTNWPEDIWKIFEGDEHIILVCSEETYHGAIEVNENLRDADRYNETGEHYYPVTVVVIPIVKSEDGQKISSTRIRKGEINLNGNVIKNADR